MSRSSELKYLVASSEISSFFIFALCPSLFSALATLAPTGGLPPAANAFLAQAAAQANGQMTPNNRNRVEISVDLITAAKDELSFLAEVNKYCNLYKGPAVKNAIR